MRAAGIIVQRSRIEDQGSGWAGREGGSAGPARPSDEAQGFGIRKVALIIALPLAAYSSDSGCHHAGPTR
jgi:hypothetical protein